MSDEEDDEDEYDFGGLSYGNANYEDGGNWEGQVGVRMSFIIMI